MIKGALQKTVTWLLAIIIGIIILYRLALVYGWLPPGFSPKALAEREYAELKIILLERSIETDALGRLSRITLNVIISVEGYLKEQAKRRAEEEELSKECQENSLFRFFMHMDDPSRAECTKRNLKLDKADKDLRGEPNEQESE